MPGLTAQGFEIKTVEAIVQDIGDGVHADVDPRVNVTAGSPTGNFIGVFASRLAEVWELGQACHSGSYPDSASGFQLTSLASLTATLRDPAKPSRVLCNCTLATGTTFVAGSLKGHVAGDPLARFHNLLDVVVPVAIPATTLVTDIVFVSDDNGPVRANAGTLTVIAEALAGFSTITNPTDATLGALIESDTDLRIRRESELARRGSTSTDAIRADLLAVADVVSVAVLSNETDVVDAQGLRPHSVEAIVRGGTDDDIAAALFNSKSGGTRTEGSTSVSFTDTQGVIHTVKFSRPSILLVYVEVHLTAKSSTYGGDTLVKTSLTDFGDSTFQVGEDVILSRLAAEIWAKVSGIVDVTSILIGVVHPPLGVVNMVVALRELADLDTSRIDVVATLV